MAQSRRIRVVLQAVLVTFLWSTSWVLIKQGLKEIPPLTFAGLRYSMAFAVLAPGLVRHRGELRNLEAREWGGLVVLGLLFYALTQGGQFLTLQHLEATPFSLILSCTPAVVAVAATFVLREILRPMQWIGILVFLGGAMLYFIPLSAARGGTIGFALATATLVANAASAILGRALNRSRIASPIVVTGVSMGVGAALLLGAGLGTQGLPSLSLRAWGIVIWLAVVNTAFAFTLWNRTLRTLSAVQSSLINNTMLIQIAILAWVFLGEAQSMPAIAGLTLAAIGVGLVQVQRREPRSSEPPNGDSCVEV